ncbi:MULTISPECIES: hypothetical protein [Bacteria]|jgi:hypothetical protein|uniref:hypothetical protein n=1 Tax=Bacteria TaxID=2 RepID=UPI0022C63F8D|nr:hypothetical protein [Dolichospermum circinale]MCA3080503.1 hypothetical protein [Rhodocyclaceae bacterium]MCZ8195435.1 hypothetical protein [Aquidulcibacter sp.]MDB9476832.1 hypothetical protein [Dolichospermum circinale CS-537/11]
MMKKTWTAPVVEELDIAATLGGIVATQFENQVTNFNNGTPPAFGSIPTGSR